MGFGPGCHEVRTGSAYVACPGCDGLVKLATCSHMRSIAQHDVPTSARHVYGNLRDKWTCQARLNAFGATLLPWHDKLTFATSQQTFRRRLCFRSMCKWTPDFQALPVLPLAIIRPPCISSVDRRQSAGVEPDGPASQRESTRGCGPAQQLPKLSTLIGTKTPAGEYRRVLSFFGT